MSTEERLQADIKELQERVGKLLTENEELRKENARLRKIIEEWKRGHRERGKRRSSRPEGRKKGKRKRPGRKAGHPGARRPPVEADRTVEYPMPGQCECGGCVMPTGETDETVVQDIPPVKPENVKHVAPVGHCQKCGRRVVAKLPGAPASGAMIVQSQLGPHAHALIVSLRFEHQMPMPQISRFVSGWFGLSITPGGIHHLLTRARQWSTASYDEIASRVQSSPVVGIDETGLRQDGVTGWTWLARTDEASLFRVELSRASWVAEAMLGSDFRGVVCSDFYAVYTAKTEWRHAYCGGHAIRDAKKIAEVSPGLWTESFRDELSDWYAAAKVAQKNGSREERQELRDQLDRLVTRTWDGTELQTLAARLDEHFEGVVYFLDHRSVPADNNSTERDIRPVASYRKVTGGTRSEAGSKNLAHWMSVGQTLRKNDLSLHDYVHDVWYARLEERPPPSVFASG